MTDSQERVWVGRCPGLGGQGRGRWRKHRRGLGIGGGKGGGERQPPGAGVAGKADDSLIRIKGAGKASTKTMRWNRNHNLIATPE